MSLPNDKLDLDFDSIVAPAEVPVEEKTTEKKVDQKLEKQETEEPKKAKADFKVCIKVSNTKFKVLDVGTCSGEDFLGFVDYVYPGSKRTAENFSTRDSRLLAIKHIIRSHQLELSWLRTQERKNKEIKPD
jgi:hypothetical protein